MDLGSMMLIHELNIPESSNFSKGILYKDHNFIGQFDRVGYHIELLSKTYGHQTLTITMNPFSEFFDHHCVPSLVNTNGKIYHQKIHNVNIISNQQYITCGNNINGCHIEYSPYNYDPFINPSQDVFVKNGSFGCMQIFNNDQCIFAYNNFNNLESICDLGIGQNPKISDWTFAKNGNIYIVKKIMFYARPTFNLLITHKPTFNLSYSLDIPLFSRDLSFNVDKNNFHSISFPFNRIGYFFYLQPIYGHYQYIWISCDAFTSNLSSINLPCKNSSKIKIEIKNIEIETNTNIKLDSTSGYIIMSPHNYLPFNNSFGVNNILMDEGNYGIFQIYSGDKLLLAYNNFYSIPDIGIGSNILGNMDWTFSNNAHLFNVRRLEILTQPSKACGFIPEACKMRLLYSTPFKQNFDVFNVTSISQKSFNRIGYFIHFKHDILGEQWIWTSFETFTKNPDQLSIFNPKKTKEHLDHLISFGNSHPVMFHTGTLISNKNEFTVLDNNNNQIWSFSNNKLNNYHLDTFNFKHIECYVNNMSYIPDFVILLTGQSNSQGFGGYYDSTNIDDTIHPNIYSWNIDDSSWELADLQKHMGTKPYGYQCLAFHFAKQLLLDQPSLKIGILVYGMGSQSISRWSIPNISLPSSKNNSKIDTADIYYDTCIQITQALSLTKNSKLNCVLWHQGEADWNESHIYYERRLLNVINQYRCQDFSQPNIPFICGELSKHHLLSWKQNHVLKSLNSNLDPYSRCAFTKNFDHALNDPIHFSSQSHREMGKSYYEQYKMIDYYSKLL